MYIFTPYTPTHSELLRLTNQVRRQHGLGELHRHFALDQAASWMARDMFEHDYTGHLDSRGNRAKQRVERYGYLDRIGSWAIAENVATGYATPASVVAGWMSSEGHRQNLLHENWVSIGLGHCARRWVQVFGSI